MAREVLIVDDEPVILDTLGKVLRDEDFEVTTARTGEEALARVQEEPPDAVLLDIWLPGLDGLETLKGLRGRAPGVPVIMMSGHGDIETAVRATKLGAFDFLEKPLDRDKVILSLNHVLELHKLEEENRLLRQKIDRRYEITGESRVIRALKAQIQVVAPTDSWVLIVGENGTGKELVARTIHRLSRRASQAFVEVNCAAIPEELIESELFGHEKGAFTGASSRKRGKFDLAHEGTLFLDEIADMSLKTQAKILRILQEQKFERVGGDRAIEVNVRVLAATNKNLEEEIRRGRFREDLFYRINVIPLHVPPLRERREDIRPLVESFLGEFSGMGGRERKQMSQEALDLLRQHGWPGNVRELRNLVERLVIMTPDPIIRAEHLPDLFRPGGRAEAAGDHFWGIPLLRAARSEFEKAYIVRKLREHRGNISRTAEAIGIARENLQRKIKAYGIEAGG
ncbi:MAG: sigma-54-dependent Fis family transcriptional regulator [Deltaproteobacteria bacterium]|nr:sigma-54-dependent Fis family transcriptional regulator [Deltaproteobacteria bacterium]